MRINPFRLNTIITVILFSTLICGGAAVHAESAMQWKMSGYIESHLLRMPAALDTSLPAPALLPEPEYTLGYENTVYWNGDSIQNTLAPSGWTILFYKVSGYSPISGELWGFVDAGIDSAMYTDLPLGVTVSYRLKYYAVNAENVYASSRWSVPETTIQDVSPPTLSSADIIDLNISRDLRWVSNQTIDVHVVALDLDSGKVMQVVFQEVNGGTRPLFFYDIVPPRAQVDTIIPYPLFSGAHVPFNLDIRVIDVAGQSSEKISIPLFWWESESDVVCFPNPFCPERGDISRIQVKGQNISVARIFDPFGQLVRVLQKPPASEFFEWDGRNGKGDIVSKGGYLCVIDGRKDMYCKIAVYK